MALALAAIAPSVAAAEGPANLLTAANVRLDGQADGDTTGSSVAAAGDPNNDGIDDVIVGASGADPTGPESGEGSAYVVYGRASPGAVSLSSLGSAGFRIDGQAVFDGAGTSVAAAGDPNDDGIDDVIVGALNADNNGGNSGSAYVVYGQNSADPADVALSGLGARGFRIDGEASGDQAGLSVGAAGDPNDDGIEDLIVGAPSADNAGTSSGSAYVVYGQSAADPADLALSALAARGFRIDGQAVADSAGTSVAAAGDPNDDGIDDVIVSARLADNSGSDSGSAYVVYGQSAPDPADLALSALAARGFRIDGQGANDNLGSGRASVAIAGDPNDDGIDDVIVGAHFADNSGGNSGSAYVVYGQSTADPPDIPLSGLGAGGFRIDGETANDFAGNSVAAAGDPNNDGIDDVIVGAHFANNNGGAGSAYVVYGSRIAGNDLGDLPLSTITTTNTGRGLRIDGQVSNDQAGFSVAAAGDPNDDGIDDVIVGAPLADNGTSNSGSAYVLGQVPSAGPGSLSFGSVGSPVAQGTVSPSQSFTVTNNELAPVSIDGFAFAGANPDDFIVASDTCRGIVEALTTCTASIRFAPQAQGIRTATLTALVDGLPDPAATALTGTAGGLPQGPAGADGAQGPQGIQGPAGAQGPAGEPAVKLFLAFASAKQTAKAGKKVSLGYVATTRARTTLEVRKGSKLIATVEADAAEGRNTISWDGKDASGKKAKPGTYALALSAESSDGQTASDVAKLTVKRK